LPASAQVNLDMNKLTCGEWLGYDSTNKEFVRFFMSGYYSASRNNNVLDLNRVQRNSAKVAAYCKKHKSDTLPTAIQKVASWPIQRVLTLAHGARLGHPERRVPGGRYFMSCANSSRCMVLCSAILVWPRPIAQYTAAGRTDDGFSGPPMFKDLRAGTKFLTLCGVSLALTSVATYALLVEK
jgi:hypothetical protein